MVVRLHEFGAALLDPERPAPEGLRDPEGRPAGKRFDVYRNNVAASLTEALIAGFPTVHALVGDEFFRAMAGVALRAHPPRSQLMMQYGIDFPEFIEGFAPTGSLPYLADVARLDLAMRQSYHAADAAPLPAEALSIPPERLMGARLTLAPAARLLRSPYPIHAIYMANHAGGPAPSPGGQDVLILRAEFDPAPHLLGPGDAEFIESLAKGAAFSDALEAAGDGFDLAALLGVLLAGGGLVGLEEGT